MISSKRFSCINLLTLEAEIGSPPYSMRPRTTTLMGGNSLGAAKAMKVDGVKLIVQDKGALDYVIKARVQTAILRASSQAQPDWSEL